MKNGKYRRFFLVVSKDYWFRTSCFSPQNDAYGALWDTRSSFAEGCVHTSQTMPQITEPIIASTWWRSCCARHMRGEDMAAARPPRLIQHQFMALARCSFASARCHLARLTGRSSVARVCLRAPFELRGMSASHAGVEGFCRDAASRRRDNGRIGLHCLCQRRRHSSDGARLSRPASRGSGKARRSPARQNFKQFACRCGPSNRRDEADPWRKGAFGNRA